MDGLQSALSRINEIQSTIASETQSMAGPGFDQALQAAMQPTTQTAPPVPVAASGMLPNSSGLSPALMQMMQQQAQAPTPVALPPLAVTPLAQSNSISCGQTSVAMAVNALTGKNLHDYDINPRYGFGLLNALNGETADKGIKWHDAGELGTNTWASIDQKVNVEHTPVIVGLNGPEFSPSGHGHIVTIVKTEGDTVTYADPASGQLKTTTKQAMDSAPPHPDGKFVFVADIPSNMASLGASNNTLASTGLPNSPLPAAPNQVGAYNPFGGDMAGEVPSLDE